MNKKVEHIGNQYTSQENKKKQRQKMKMRVVRRRIALFGGILFSDYPHSTCIACHSKT